MNRSQPSVLEYIIVIVVVIISVLFGKKSQKKDGSLFEGTVDFEAEE